MTEDQVDKIIETAGLTKEIDIDWSRTKKVNALIDKFGEE